MIARILACLHAIFIGPGPGLSIAGIVAVATTIPGFANGTPSRADWINLVAGLLLRMAPQDPRFAALAPRAPDTLTTVPAAVPAQSLSEPETEKEPHTP